jgi:hypothetical protein
MNNSYYTISTTSDNGILVYFDLREFALLKQSAYRFARLADAASMARLLADEHRRETRILDADGAVALAAPTPPRPVSDRPAMTESPYGWPMSAEVLGFFTDGRIHVVTCEQHDSDRDPQWYTACSERWNVTGSITHWTPRPPGVDAYKATVPDQTAHAVY